MNNDIDCPVDLVPINENKVRLVAMLVLALAVGYLLTGYWGIIAFLVVDFALRSFKLNQYSPLAYLAGSLIKLLGIGVKLTDQAPKRFAARMGLAFNVVILTLHFAPLAWVTQLLVLVLCFFAFLESVLAICVGCHVYSFYIKLGGK